MNKNSNSKDNKSLSTSYSLNGDKMDSLPDQYIIDGKTVIIEREFLKEGNDFLTLLYALFEKTKLVEEV